MIPIKYEGRRPGFPSVTLALVALCVAAFFTVPPGIAPFVPLDFMYGVFHPSSGLLSAVVALIASLFSHASIAHLAGNLWYLWLFGGAAEAALGARAFALLYVAAGSVAASAQALSTPLSTVPIVGASGAIAGVMGLTLITQPRSRLVCYFPPVFFFPVPSVVFLLLWFGIQYINLRFADPVHTTIAWWAHIGGFVFGTAAGIVRALTASNGRRRKRGTRK